MENLRKLRQERNLTQQRLAQLLGTTQQSVHKYETGKAQADQQMLMAMADFFHTSVDYLIGYTDNPAPNRTTTDSDTTNTAVSSPESREYFATTPKERYHLAMYRRLSSHHQQCLDSLLEEFAPDQSYTQFIKSKKQVLEDCNKKRGSI